MKKLALTLCVAAVMAALFFAAGLESQDAARAPVKATGFVFHDANGNGKRDAGEKGLPRIRVSNGIDIVKTADDGSYSVNVDDDSIIFVIKPKGWRTPINENQLPQFYYIHKPAGSPPLKYKGVDPTGPLPKSVDFALTPQQEPEQFKAILFGDPQPRDQKEIDYIAHDVVEELIGTDASFGVTLGDILFDDLALFESQARSIALIGIPWYNVIGNHDINYDARSDRTSDETFERAFGPSYYSFDYGTVHFLVLDDIEWSFPDGAEKGKYRGGLGKRQMQFIRNDLAVIPDDQLVVLLMHIPLVNVADRQELYRLIEQRPFCISISGHTHHHEHRFITKEDGWMGPEPHHHIINVTVSGSWWSGAPDERGIPHTQMADGAPNGYSIISFDGTDYSLDFKAAGRSADYQMQIHAPEVLASGKEGETTVFVNVFNGSAKDVTEMRVGGGAWIRMEHTVAIDPQLQQVFDLEATIKELPWRKMSKPKNSTHLWKATLPKGLSAGSQLIEIRSKNLFGKTVSGRRIIRVQK